MRSHMRACVCVCVCDTEKERERWRGDTYLSIICDAISNRFVGYYIICLSSYNKFYQEQKAEHNYCYCHL